MNFIKYSSLCFSASIAAGCTTPHVVSGVETRAFLEESCITTGGKANVEFTGLEPLLVGFAANIVGKAAGVGIDAISKQLKDDKHVDVSNVERTPYILSGSKAGVSLNSGIGCVIAIVGSFDKSQELSSAVENLASQLDVRGSALEGLKIRAEDMSDRGKAIIKSLGRVYVYSEYQIVSSRNAENLSYDTGRFVVNEFVGEDFGVASSTRDVKITVELSAPGTPAFYSVTSEKVSLNKKELPYVSNELRQGPWQAIDPKLRVNSGDANSSFLPGNLTVQYLETGKPGQLSKLIGDAISDQKASVATLAGNQTRYALSNEEAQAAQVTKANTAAARLTEYQTAYDSAKRLADDLKSIKIDDPSYSNKRSNLKVQLSLTESRKDLVKAAFRDAGLSFTSNPPIDE